MSDIISTAMEGAKQIMRAQSINANNLANASTAGFRGELAHVMGSDIQQGLVSAPDFTPGPVRTTGRDLDVSINGDGWFAVIGPDGTEAYSRRGDLHVDALGQLRNGAGQQLLGDGGPVALPPHATVEIAPDGTISVIPLGQTPNTLAQVGRLKLVNPPVEEMQRGTDGLMRLPLGEAADADAGVKLTAGTLEGSNVNAVDSMVRMIDLARQFEAQVQLMKSSQENESTLNKILSM